MTDEDSQKTKKPDYWFKRRRYGWGWIPVRREGWLAVGTYIVIVVILAILFPGASALGEVIIFLLVVAATAGLLVVCYQKGPTPKWRWGRDEEDDPQKDF